MTRCSSREQQVGDVCASDQQNEGDGSEQNQQSRPDVADLIFSQHHQAYSTIHLAGILLFNVACDGVHVRSRLLETDAGLEARYSVEVMIIAVRRHVDCRPQHMFGHRLARRNPEVGLSREPEDGGHHSDYGQRLAVGGELLADDVGVRGEAALPKALTYDDDSAAAAILVVGLKNAAQDWLHAQDWKQAGGGHDAHARSGLSPPVRLKVSCLYVAMFSKTWF